MGVFRIRNTVDGRSLIGTSVNLPAILNRHRFGLESGTHANRELLEDWRRLGPEAFVFEELDRIEPSNDPTRDPSEELAELKALWVEKLRSEADGAYE